LLSSPGFKGITDRGAERDAEKLQRYKDLAEIIYIVFGYLKIKAIE
jgi:hypothetical protein